MAVSSLQKMRDIIQEKERFVYKRIIFFLFCSIFLITGFSHVKNPNGSNLQENCVFAGEIFESNKKFYSQHYEELIIRDFFNDRKGGIFVDVGCSHYKDLSTTYYLEEHLGWSGIAIDALAEYAIGYIDHRPNTRFFNFIVTSYSGGIESFYRSINAKIFSSTSENMAKGRSKYFGRPTECQVVYVPTITLTDLLEKNGISKIDLLSMDIQGGEVKALSGFNIEQFKPKLVCIEVENSDPYEILNYFAAHGYERIDKYSKYDSTNWYFKPKDP